LFHGPTFQAVETIDQVGDDGIVATLRAPIDGGPFSSAGEASMLIDPITLDAMGQVVACWVAEHYARSVNVFPFRLERLTLHGAGLAAGERARCRVRVREIDEERMVSDIDVLAESGSTRARMVGWEDRRIHVPAPIREFFADPRGEVLSEPWSDAIERLESPQRFRACRLAALPTGLLLAYGEIWLRALALLTLGRRERTAWEQLLLAASPKRRLEWLQGRIAAKDAVRLLVANSTGRLLCPADVQIDSDERGRPTVTVPDQDAVAVTIAHTAEVAVALAGFEDGLGVDIEAIDAMSAEVGRAAFSPTELSVLDQLPGGERDERLTRGWCAKEALGKAVGLGLSGGPRAARIAGAQSDGTLLVALAPNSPEPTPNGNDRPLPVGTGRDGGYVFGICRIEGREPDGQPG
jgi:phosphopantetheinyl transferase